MEIPDDFQNLAQIAIALAGFTGIIGVFQRRGGAALSEREKIHIVNLLQASALVAVLAFVPSCLALVPQADFDIWPWSIRIMFAAHLIAWYIGSVSIRRFFAILNALPSTERLVFFRLLLPIAVILTTLEGVLAFGNYPDYIPLVYELVLLFFLCLAMANFFSLLFDTTRGNEAVK
ncbi:MAG: hypothetical protein ACU84Q_21805 [Gammaproteobacteria bacterium]